MRNSPVPCGFGRDRERARYKVLSLERYLTILSFIKLQLLDVWTAMPVRVLLMMNVGIYEGLSETFNLYTETKVLTSFQEVLEGKAGAKDGLYYWLFFQMLFYVSDEYIMNWCHVARQQVFDGVKTSMKSKYLAKLCTFDVATREDDRIQSLIAKANPMDNASLSELAEHFRDFVRRLIAVPGSLILLWQMLDGSQGNVRWLPLVIFVMVAAERLLMDGERFEWFEPVRDWLFATDQRQEEKDALAGWISAKAYTLWTCIVRGEYWAEHWINASYTVFQREWQAMMMRMPKSEMSYQGYKDPVVLRKLLFQGLYVIIASHTVKGGSTKIDMAMINMIRSSITTALLSLTSLDRYRRDILRGLHSIGLYRDFLEMKPILATPQDPAMYQGGKGMKIEFRHVTFTYPRKTEPSLVDVTFTIESGETADFIGFNGAGKSTMAKLMLRLYDPQEGTILINDVDIRDYHSAVLYKHMGVVFQDYARYDRQSVGRNIGLACPPLMDFVPALEEATTAAGFNEHIATLKYRYDTLLSSVIANSGKDDGPYRGNYPPFEDDDEEEKADKVEEKQEELYAKRDPRHLITDEELYEMFGSMCKHRAALSGGQWQKLSLSRLFLRKSYGQNDKDCSTDLLILDEPTAALDAKAESALVDQMQDLSKNGSQTVTTIYISHRFTTILASDRILCMKEGRVVENGTHAELMAIENGIYHELYTAAAKPFQGR